MRRWSLQLHDWYAHGDCAAFAFAVSDITGWPVVYNFCWPCVVELCPKEGGGPHIMVRHPSGRLLDIDGLHDDPGGMLNVGFIWRQRESVVHGLTRAQIDSDAQALVNWVLLTGEMQ
jgi:hypothetical protein